MGTSAPTQKLSSVGRGRCLIGPPSMAGQTTWHELGGPGGSGKPKHLPRQGPVARKEGWRPLKFCPPEGSSSRRGPTKNGVLVPLPPWAKEPAAGAAESFYFLKQQKREPSTDGSLFPQFNLHLWKAQRRNEVSHKVLCQAFFQESGQASWELSRDCLMSHSF